MTRHKDFKNYTQVVDILINLDAMSDRMIPGATDDDCIGWRGPFHRQGYAMFSGVRIADDKRIMLTVHRLLMKQHLNRMLDEKEMVIHTCSNPQCLNINHMVLGDARLRNKVMSDNGRAGPRLRGKHSKDHKKQNRTYKYSEQEMLWARYAAKEDIAKHFGIPIERARQLQWNFINKYRWLNAKDEKYQDYLWDKINKNAR